MQAVLEEVLHAAIESTGPGGVKQMLTEASHSDLRRIISDGDIFAPENRSGMQMQLNAVPPEMQRTLLISMSSGQIESFKKLMGPALQVCRQLMSTV